MTVSTGTEFTDQKALAAIVFTDVAGFSQRAQQDEARTLSSMRRDISLMESVCRKHRGMVLKTLGDGVMMKFASAQDAVTAGMEIQRLIYQQSLVLDPFDALEHRMGIHLGDIIITPNDVMGDGVNIAARLQAIAAPGAICLSRTVYDVTKGKTEIPAKYLGPRTLKGIREPVMVWQIPAAKDLDKEKRHQALDAFAPAQPSSDGLTGFKAFLVIAGCVAVIAVGLVFGVKAFHSAETAQKKASAAAASAPHQPTLADRLGRKTKEQSGQAAKPQDGIQGATSGSQTQAATGQGIQSSAPSQELLTTLKPLYDACKFDEMAQAIKSDPFGATPDGQQMANQDSTIAALFVWLEVVLKQTSATNPISLASFPGAEGAVKVFQTPTGVTVVTTKGPVNGPLESFSKPQIAAIAQAAASVPGDSPASAPASLPSVLQYMLDQGKLFGENP